MTFTWISRNSRIILTCALSWGFTAAATKAQSPAEIRLTLSGGKECVEFKAIYLGIANVNVIASRSVTLGSVVDPKFREPLTDVTLSGSFIGHHKDRNRREWCYYLGATEVTESQWAAVMGGAGTGSKMPKTDVTLVEIESFLEKLNKHLLQQERQKLPKLNGHPGFCRLPTEAEWEFAARGGAEVDDATYDSEHPYKELGEHEWFDAEVKPCGGLDPNPVGLRDMLSNVAEITQSWYSFEYGHGRLGGRVARGAVAKESRADIRASRREEYTPHFTRHPNEGEPRRSPDHGFRLALASPVFGPHMDRDLEPALAKYSKTRDVVSSDLSQQIADTAAERKRNSFLQEKINRLKTDLAKLQQDRPEPRPDLEAENEKLITDLRWEVAHDKQTIAQLRIDKAKLESDNAKVSRIVNESIRIKVEALVLTANFAINLVNYNDEVRRRVAAAAPELAKLNAEKRDRHVRDYRRALIPLSKSNPVIVSSEISKRREDLREIGNSTKEQRSLDVLELHLGEFREKERELPTRLLEDIRKHLQK